MHDQNFHMYLPEFLYFRGAALAGLERKAEAREILSQTVTVMRQTNDRL